MEPLLSTFPNKYATLLGTGDVASLAIPELLQREAVNTGQSIMNLSNPSNPNIHDAPSQSSAAQSKPGVGLLDTEMGGGLDFSRSFFLF